MNKTTGKNPVSPQVRIKKSEKLTEAEKLAFEEWLKNQDTKVDAALILDINRCTLDRVAVMGSGKPETVAKIRQILKVKNRRK